MLSGYALSGSTATIPFIFRIIYQDILKIFQEIIAAYSPKTIFFEWWDSENQYVARFP